MLKQTTEKSYLNRPKAHGITVRKLQFNPKAIRRHYFANSPVMSHLLTALSSTFPIGEQFFVHSVRNVRDQVTDAQLQAQIAAFIGQEAMHSKAHMEFNQAWRHEDYNLDRFQDWLARKDHHVKNLHPKIQLAITCAFEHFTALLGGYILRHPEILASSDEDTGYITLSSGLRPCLSEITIFPFGFSSVLNFRNTLCRSEAGMCIQTALSNIKSNLVCNLKTSRSSGNESLNQ